MYVCMYVCMYYSYTILYNTIILNMIMSHTDQHNYLLEIYTSNSKCLFKKLYLVIYLKLSYI